MRIALGMTTDALRARVKRRQIPFVRVGRRVYFTPEQLQAWIAERSMVLAAGQSSTMRGIQK
jgi:hypothetical protein